MSEPALVQIDPNFAILYHNINGVQSDDVQTLIVTLMRFRKGLSFNWLNSFQRVDPQGCLSAVISTVLEFTEHENATIRVNSYSTLGALLLCVAPFAPLLFIRSFGHATSQMPVSPKRSVAIINMFVYLTRFVSPVRMSEFVSMVPVVHHFGVDVSDYVSHLPHIIPMMKDLPVEFHQNILRSILVSCARKPTYAFANSVALLVSLNKQKLTRDLLSFCTGNQLESAIVWIGPLLLVDDEVYEIMGEEGREIFLSEAIKQLSKEKPQLGLFEYACKIAAIFLKKTYGTPMYDAIHTRIYSGIPKTLKPAFQGKLLNLPTPISEIKLNDDDLDSLKGAKLNAVVNYFMDSNFTESVNADEVAEFFLPYKESENDLYCTFVECFGSCAKELLCRCKNTKAHIDILKFILTKKNKNWVHDEAVCKLIDKIPVSVAKNYLPEYQELALDRLLEFALSTTNRLLNTAVSSVISLASYSNIENIIMRIYYSDWVDEDVVCRRFGLLSELAAIFKSELFSLFIDIAYECILTFDDTNLLSNVFAFLSHVPIDHMPDTIRTFSFKFIITQYQMFSRRKMEYPYAKYSAPIPKNTFVETLDTDIVTNPTFDHQTVMMPSKNCFAFLYSLPRALLVDTDSLFWASFYLVPILDKYAIDAAASLITITSPYYDNLWNLGLETFKATSKDEVSASCVKLFTNCPKPLPDIVEKMLEKYLTTAGTDTDLVFLAFIIVDQQDHELAIEGVRSLLNKVDTTEACKLLFKLIHVTGMSLVKEIKDEHAPALLQYAIDIGDVYEKRVLEYFTTKPFHEWPVGDSEMDSCTARFLGNHKQVVKIDDLSKLDMAHWEFLFVYKNLFDLENVSKYIIDNPEYFAKIQVDSFLPKKEIKPFVMPEVSVKYTIASIQPNIERGEFIEEISLITSFCQSAQRKASPEQVQKMFDFALQRKNIPCIKAVLHYIERYKFSISLEPLLKEHELAADDDVLLQIIAMQKKPISEYPPILVSIIEEKLEEKISPEMILLASKKPLLQALVKSDPEYFFKYYTDDWRFTSSKLLKLVPLLQQTQFDGEKLIQLAESVLSKFNEYESKQKKLAILRFVFATLASLKSQRKKAPLFQSFIQKVYESIPELTKDMQPSYVQELNYLFNYMIPFVQSVDDIVNIVQWVSSFGTTAIHIWSVSAALLQNTKDVPMPFLTQQLLEEGFTNPIASIRASTVRALSCYLATNAPEKGFEMIDKVSYPLHTSFGELGKNFRTAQATAQLMSRILVNANVDKIPLAFYASFINNFIGRLGAPQLDYSLSLFPRLAPRVGKIFETAISLTYTDFEVVEVLNEIYTVMTSSGAKTKEQYFFDYFEQVEKYFIKFPSFEMGQLLLRIIADGAENVNAPSYLFSKLPMTVTNFLPLFQVLVVFYRDAQPQVKDIVDVIVESMSSVISPATRGQAMRMIIGGGDIGLATAIAAAEVDDMSKIEGL